PPPPPDRPRSRTGRGSRGGGARSTAAPATGCAGGSDACASPPPGCSPNERLVRRPLFEVVDQVRLDRPDPGHLLLHVLRSLLGGLAAREHQLHALEVALRVEIRRDEVLQVRR